MKHDMMVGENTVKPFPAFATSKYDSANQEISVRPELKLCA